MVLSRKLNLARFEGQVKSKIFAMVLEKLKKVIFLCYLIFLLKTACTRIQIRMTTVLNVSKCTCRPVQMDTYSLFCANLKCYEPTLRWLDVVKTTTIDRVIWRVFLPLYSITMTVVFMAECSLSRISFLYILSPHKLNSLEY